MPRTKTTVLRRMANPDIAEKYTEDECRQSALPCRAFEDGQIPQDAPKRVTIYEVLDQTASARLEAWWGIDYVHLAKFDGRWMIVNVLWQTFPAAD
jgi:hypothetical protein